MVFFVELHRPRLTPDIESSATFLYPCRFEFMKTSASTIQFTFVMLGVAVLLYACDTKCDALPSACELAPEPGPCFAAIPKYYFDSVEQTCKEFTWGGCGGVVPFDTLEECQQCDCD